jgi:hypothetical protein
MSLIITDFREGATRNHWVEAGTLTPYEMQS